MVRDQARESPGTASGAVVYRRSGDVVARRIAGEYLLVPIRGEVADLQRIFVLNSVGERIWDALDADRRFDDLCGIVEAAFEVDRPTVERDVAEFIGEMEKAGLLSRLARGEEA
jgi:hypothetical protein